LLFKLQGFPCSYFFVLNLDNLKKYKNRECVRRNRALPSRVRSAATQRGYLMVELALVLIITTILTASQVAKVQETFENTLARATGQYMQALQAAVNLYQTTNDAALKVAMPTVSGFADALHPTTTELINGHYLPQGFSLISPLGLAFKHELTQHGCPGASCVIQGYTFSTTGYRELGTIVRSDITAAIIETIGIDGSHSLVADLGLCMVLQIHILHQTQ